MITILRNGFRTIGLILAIFTVYSYAVAIGVGLWWAF